MELVTIFQDSPIYLLVEPIPLQWLPCLLIDLAITNELFGGEFFNNKSFISWLSP
jgi:hypothetical protein